MTTYKSQRSNDEKSQPLQFSIICQHCTCNNLITITKDSIREDYSFRCYWCGKINAPVQDVTTPDESVNSANTESVRCDELAVSIPCTESTVLTCQDMEEDRVDTVH
jgi:hypothetical protein